MKLRQRRNKSIVITLEDYEADDLASVLHRIQTQKTIERYDFSLSQNLVVRRLGDYLVAKIREGNFK